MQYHLFAVLSWLAAVRAVDPTVTIDGGAVIGTAVSIPKTTARVNEFLGIPFAAPPERFSPPQPAKSWHEPLVAQAFKPACIQQFNCTTNCLFENHKH
jgi:carboxylesterase type B